MLVCIMIRYLYRWYNMKNKKTLYQSWWEKEHMYKDKNSRVFHEPMWDGQGIQVQKNIIDILGQENNKELNTLITMVDNTYEVLTCMNQSIEKGLLDVQEAKAYIEINGQKIESILFNDIKNRYGTAQAILTWIQVRTKDFKQWFGDWQTNPGTVSKAIDSNGEPLLMFRGDHIGKEVLREELITQTNMEIEYMWPKITLLHWVLLRLGTRNLRYILFL